MLLPKGNQRSTFRLLAILLLWGLPVFGATLVVTNNHDSGPGSLRAMIASANSGDTITFMPGLASPIILTSGQLSIVYNLTISGPGASVLAISGGNASRVFAISPGITAAISGLTIRDGYSGNLGGGIYNGFGASLTVTNSTLSGNHAENGGGISNQFGASLTLTNSTLSGNSAAGDISNGGGGGILNSGPLTVTNSTLSGNSATSSGGGIDNYDSLTVINSTLSGNTVPGGSGGGIANEAQSMTVINSTLFGNVAAYGGAIYNLGGITVTNSTLSGNSANGSEALFTSGGGGIANGGIATLKNTLLAGNPVGGNCVDPFNSVFSAGHNLSDDASCASALAQVGDRTSAPAGFDGSLMDNGGPTQTIALLPTSNAVDAIPVSPINYCTLANDITVAPVGTDQRGVSRPQGSACDIGAYELAKLTFNIPHVTFYGAGLFGGFDLDVTATVDSPLDVIDPVTQPVTIAVGPHSFTIPAGSFHPGPDGQTRGSWFFFGAVDRALLGVQIDALGDGSVRVQAGGWPVDFSGLTSPATIKIAIGVNRGTAEVRF